MIQGTIYDRFVLREIKEQFRLFMSCWCVSLRRKKEKKSAWRHLEGEYSQYVSVVSRSIVSCFNFEFFFPIFISCVLLWLRPFVCLLLDCFQLSFWIFYHFSPPTLLSMINFLFALYEPLALSLKSVFHFCLCIARFLFRCLSKVFHFSSTNKTQLLIFITSKVNRK